MVTLLAEETETEKKLLAGLLSAMLLVDPALKDEPAVTERGADWVMSPLVLTVSVPVMEQALRTRALMSLIEAFFAAVIPRELKSLLSSRVMS